MVELKEDIFQVKSRFLDALSKGNITSFEQLQFNTIDEYKLENQLLKKWYNNIVNLNFLDFTVNLLEEIYIHCPTHIVYKTSKNKINHDSDITQQDLQAAFEVLALKQSISWNYKNPFASFDVTINDMHLRITLTHFSLSSINLSKCFIRVLNSRHIALNSFENHYDLSFIKESMLEKKNILIAGSTGSGKTTYISSLLMNISIDDHLVILEDVNEIAVPNKNTTKLLANDSQKQTSLNSYMSYALRMSPDRIVIGEIRAKEVESYLLAMNTGHNGLLTTIHANSAKDAVDRIALLFKIYSAQELSYELVLKLVCNNIDLVVFLENKKVKEVISLFGSEKEQVFYESVI